MKDKFSILIMCISVSLMLTLGSLSLYSVFQNNHLSVFSENKGYTIKISAFDDISNKPVIGANIIIPKLNSYITNESGIADFVEIPNEIYTAIIYADGYEPYALTVFDDNSEYKVYLGKHNSYADNNDLFEKYSPSSK